MTQEKEFEGKPVFSFFVVVGEDLFYKPNYLGSKKGLGNLEKRKGRSVRANTTNVQPDFEEGLQKPSVHVPKQPHLDTGL